MTKEDDHPAVRWGIGLEHEIHLQDESGRLSPVSLTFLRNEILDNAEKGKPLPKELGFTDEDAAFLGSGAVDPALEFSARRCAGLSGPSERMFEIISRKYANVTFPEAIAELRENEHRFLEIASRVAGGILKPYTYGSAILHTSDGAHRKDYTGSYHVTITMPFREETTMEEFVEMHRYFAALFQWVEPLLVAVLGSPDPSAPGHGRSYPRGSMRIPRYGWGTPGGTDVRRLHDGVGRRANIIPRYLNELSFVNTPDYTKTCFFAQETNPSRKLKVKFWKVGGVRTDIRTFGIETKGMRIEIGNFRGIPFPKPTIGGFWRMIKVSGAPMHKGFGIELRIFDHFLSEHLEPLLCFLALLMEQTLVMLAQPASDALPVVHDSDAWNLQMKTALEDGCLGKCHPAYWKELMQALQLPSSSKTVPENHQVALDKLFQQLKKKNTSGPHFRLVWGDHPVSSAFPPQNLNGWIHAYLRGEAQTARIQFWKAISGKTSWSYEALRSKLPHTWDDLDLEYALHAESGVGTIRTTSSGARSKLRHIDVLSVPTLKGKQTLVCEDKTSFCKKSKSIRRSTPQA
jgi:hypothetical protein